MKKVAVKKQVTKKTQNSLILQEYKKVLITIKNQIKEAQVKSVLAANKELIKLYWQIGQIISEKQTLDGWGSRVVEKLAKDLQQEFPGLEGFSRSNIFYMRSFY